MSEWRETTLGTLINLKRGYDLPSQSRILGDIPIYSSSGVSGYHRAKMCDGPGVITGRYGTIGQIFFSRSPYWPLNTTLYVQNFKGNDELFVYYFLKQVDWEKYSDKSAVPGVNRNDVHQEEVKFLPFPEQKAIAAVLSGLDNKIDLLHRQNATLEAMAETLFRQWFVVNAKEKWEEVSITDLFEVRDGTHDSPKQTKTGKTLITSKHILDGRLDVSKAYLISEDDFNKVNQRSKVDTGDILFSMIGTIGLLYWEQSLPIDYAIKNIGLFKTSQNPDWSVYTYLWLKSPAGRQFIDEHKSGSTQEYVALGSLRSIPFQKPPIEILREFNKLALGYFSKMNLNRRQIQSLEKLRDTLLPKLMSGEVRVTI